MVDPKGFLADFKSMQITSDGEIADIKKARLLLENVIKISPKHPHSWIAAARWAEVDGKIEDARELITEGCMECPKSEFVWLEACRLASPENVKAVVARGVEEVPNSANLWLHAAKLEHDMVEKSRVLKKGLEEVPDSVSLWISLVDLASDEDARLLLERAVECCPWSVELWLALANLVTYDDEAKKVLNRAVRSLPKEPLIWIGAAKLEETKGEAGMVGKIIERGIRLLQRKGFEIDREWWMILAEEAERVGYVVTSKAMITHIPLIGVEEGGCATIYE